MTFEIEFKSWKKMEKSSEKTTSKKSPFVLLSRLDFERAEEFSSKNIKNICLNPQSAKTIREAEINGEEQIKVTRNDPGAKRCLICGSFPSPSDIRHGDVIGYRFDLYRTVFQTLESNYALPDIQCKKEELKFCCKICFKDVNQLWEFQQQLEDIRVEMKRIVNNIKIAAGRKRSNSSVSIVKDRSLNSSLSTNSLRAPESFSKHKRLQRNPGETDETVHEQLGDTAQKTIKELNVNWEEESVNSEKAIVFIDDNDSFNDYLPDNVEVNYENSSPIDQITTKSPSISKTARDSNGIANCKQYPRKTLNNKDVLLESNRSNKSPSNLEEPMDGFDALMQITKKPSQDPKQKVKYQEKFSCDGLCCSRVKGLNNHKVKVHKRIASHKCYFCGMGFFTKYELCKHMPKHTNEVIGKGFPCRICGFVYKHRRSRYYHIQLIHKKVQKPLQCTIKGCSYPYRFSRKRELLAHVRTHTNEEKPFECKKCKKRFSTQFMQRRHENTIKCEVHGAFKQPKNRKTYPNRKYFCPKCGELFHTQFLLRYHVQAHGNLDREEYPIIQETHPELTNSINQKVKFQQESFERSKEEAETTIPIPNLKSELISNFILPHSVQDLPNVFQIFERLM